MRYLYYCNSTYQLINVMNLHWHRKCANFENIDNYEADLILLNSFNGAKEIFDTIKNDNVFNNCLLLDKKYNKGIFHSMFTLLDAISPSFYFNDKYEMKKDELYNKYDVITTPKYSVIVDQIWRLNKKAKLHLYEDGIGTYYLDIPFYPSSKLQKHFSDKSDFNDYSHLYVINKDMYMSKDKHKVVEIPKMDSDYIKQFSAKFNNTNYDQNKNIYWLSQFLNNKEYNDMLSCVLKKLSKYKDKTLFCQHPRYPLANEYGFDETDGKQVWELELLKMSDISNKLFISIHSTACFSPKMLFDQEPYIIFIYKLGDYEVAHVSEEFEKIINSFIRSYSNPSKIYIPNTIEEFENCLDTIVKQMS